MRLCYCFGYGVTVSFIETRMFQTSGLNRKWCKVKFLMKCSQWLVNRNKPLIHRVHKKFYLNCIRLKHRRDWWDNGQIQIFATQWLMGHFGVRICQSAGMNYWNQDHPERYSNFSGIYIKFQWCGMWPWTCWGRQKSQGHWPRPSPVIESDGKHV